MEKVVFKPKARAFVVRCVLVGVLLLLFLGLLVWGIIGLGWFDIVLGAVGTILVLFEVKSLFSTKITFLDDRIKCVSSAFARNFSRDQMATDVAFGDIKKVHYDEKMPEVIALDCVSGDKKYIFVKQYRQEQTSEIYKLLQQKIPQNVTMGIKGHNTKKNKHTKKK